MPYDSADDTFFEKDAGGVAVKIELHDGSGLVAKVEFHPYGEKLYVYDTRNDSDTVYTWLRVGGHFYGPWSALGTSAPVEHRVVDTTSIAEGTYLLVDIYDDNGHSGSSTTRGGGRSSPIRVKTRPKRTGPAGNSEPLSSVSCAAR